MKSTHAQTIATLTAFAFVFALAPTANAETSIPTVTCTPIVQSSSLNGVPTAATSGECGTAGSLSFANAVDDCADTGFWIVTLEYASGSGRAKVSLSCGGDEIASCITEARNDPCEGRGDSTSGTPECLLFVLSGSPDDFTGACEDPVSHERLIAKVVPMAQDALGDTA